MNLLGAVKGAFRSAVVNYRCPKTLNVWWNFGSCLGVLLVSQLVTGLLLAVHYVPNSDFAMGSVYYIMRDIQGGWFVRGLHVGGANFMFVCIYVHIARGLYYGSYLKKGVWFTGVVILILLMGVSFLGYVLPWGVMSYWGAVVITSMLSIVPFIGNQLKVWVWGGYVVTNVTLKRFFILHFVLPFVLAGLTMVHVYLLHVGGGSSNPLGVAGELISFHPYYVSKDLVGFVVVYGLMVWLVLLCPDIFVECLNFKDPDPMKTPKNICPEWYFLFFYAILRMIPSKSLGILVMFGSILILVVCSYTHVGMYRGLQFYPICQFFFWCLGISNFWLLTGLGRMHAEPLVTLVSRVCSGGYFGYFLIFPVFMALHDGLVSKPRYFSE
uniref:Cytochrome b n=1 Tax=Margaritifera margaritifera TaxID=102329 RepID=S4S2A2_PINMG|nr:cytochrome b [Pinctada margaritifera]